MDERAGAGKKSKLLKTIIIVVVVLLVAAAAGVGLRWWQMNSSNSDKNQPKAVDNAQSLLSQGKTDEANKAVQDALNNSGTSQEDKFLLYVQQGRIAAVKEDFHAAADAYGKAWDIKQTWDVASKLGAAWQQLGDNAKALDFYKKAKDLVPKDSPSYDSDTHVLDMQIQSLEAGQ